eukprot:264301_1
MDTETTRKNGEISRSCDIDPVLNHKQNDFKSHICCIEYRYMFAYALLLMSVGSLETFSSAIFVELQHQLNVDKATIAFIFTVKSISFGVSSIICAYVLDSFNETHYFVAITILLSTISITLIPFIQIVSVMYILFIFIGFAIGTLLVAFPVYIFRQYPNQQTKMIYIVLTVYGICKTIIPLLIQLSISLYSSYQYALYIITIISLLTCILLLILSTPKHDTLRSIKKDISTPQMSETDDSDNDNINDTNVNHNFVHEKLKKVAIILKNDKKHMYKERIIIFMLAIIMSCFSATQSGLVNFITSYCDDYLNINGSIGRYMISGYYGGQLLYRLVFSICFGDKIKKIWLPTTRITIGFLLMNIFLILFVIFNTNISMIFIVYIGCGFVASTVFPDIFKLCELMTPVNGILSCIFLAGFSCGDGLIVFIIGEISNSYNAKILPYPLLISSVIGTIFIFSVVCLYKKYNKHKIKIISGLEMNELEREI